MDLVSFEDPEEYRHFAKIMHLGETAKDRLIQQFKYIHHSLKARMVLKHPLVKKI
jgi:hypothetical protein